MSAPPTKTPLRTTQPLTLAITSGKGGVGKSTIAANVALSLSQLGLRVTLLDGDMGLANLDVLMGLLPKRTLEHFFREGVPLEEIVIDGPAGLKVVPAGSGLPELTRLGPQHLAALVAGLQRLTVRTDVLLVDTAAGIGDHVSGLFPIADRVLLVTWPEPTALVDAYAALKVIRRRQPDQAIGLVVNGVRSADEARRVHQRLETAARQFLGTGVELDGYVLEDPAVADAARRQRPVLMAHPLCAASRSVERLALRLSALAGGRFKGATDEPCQPATQTIDIQH
jgi:flagellar biosynthesis protein FlhG